MKLWLLILIMFTSNALLGMKEDLRKQLINTENKKAQEIDKIRKEKTMELKKASFFYALPPLFIIIAAYYHMQKDVSPAVQSQNRIAKKILMLYALVSVIGVKLAKYLIASAYDELQNRALR